MLYLESTNIKRNSGSRESNRLLEIIYQYGGAHKGFSTSINALGGFQAFLNAKHWYLNCYFQLYLPWGTSDICVSIFCGSRFWKSQYLCRSEGKNLRELWDKMTEVTVTDDGGHTLRYLMIYTLKDKRKKSNIVKRSFRYIVLEAMTWKVTS